MTDIKVDDDFFDDAPDCGPGDHTLEPPAGKGATFDFAHNIRSSAEQKESRRKIIDFRCKFYELSTHQEAEVLAKYRYMRDVNDAGFDLPMAFTFNTSSNTHIDVIEEELDKFKRWVLDHLTNLKAEFAEIVSEVCVDETIRDSRGRDITTKALEAMEMAYDAYYHTHKEGKSQAEAVKLLKLTAHDPRKNIDLVRRYKKNAVELIRRTEEGSFPYNANGEWALPNA